MGIKIQIRGRVFSLCIGYRTKWFRQIYFFHLIEEWYENLDVVYAKSIWRFWKGGTDE